MNALLNIVLLVCITSSITASEKKEAIRPILVSINDKPLFPFTSSIEKKIKKETNAFYLRGTQLCTKKSGMLDIYKSINEAFQTKGVNSFLSEDNNKYARERAEYPFDVNYDAQSIQEALKQIRNNPDLFINSFLHSAADVLSKKEDQLAFIVKRDKSNSIMTYDHNDEHFFELNERVKQTQFQTVLAYIMLQYLPQQLVENKQSEIL